MAKRNGGFIGQDGLNAPDEPTDVFGSASNEQVEISFTSPADAGGAAITGYVVTSNDGIGAIGSSSPITVTGLTNDTAYTFRVWALNPFGWSSPSVASASLTPKATRGVFARASGGNDVSYITIETTGNSTDFGNLINSPASIASASNATRGVFAGGIVSGNSSNVIQYITIATTGNASNFGDLRYPSRRLGGTGNSTYGLFVGGYNNLGSGGTEFLNVINRITISSTGNASNFGDLVTGYTIFTSGLSSSTNAIFGGGEGSGGFLNVIQYKSFTTSGNTVDWGDLTQATYGMGGCSNSTRGLFGGGATPSNPVTRINYFNLSTTGNAATFGNLTVARNYISAASGPTRATWASGSNTGGISTNIIDYVTIATTGNATDFGDLTTTGDGGAGLSNGHGGLS